MKSYWMNISNGQGHMELREVDVPVPGAGQVLVKLHAASLNRGELIVGHGLSWGAVRGLLPNML